MSLPPGNLTSMRFSSREEKHWWQIRWPYFSANNKNFKEGKQRNNKYDPFKIQCIRLDFGNYNYHGQRNAKSILITSSTDFREIQTIIFHSMHLQSCLPDRWINPKVYGIIFFWLEIWCKLAVRRYSWIFVDWIAEARIRKFNTRPDSFNAFVELLTQKVNQSKSLWNYIFLTWNLMKLAVEIYFCKLVNSIAELRVRKFNAQLVSFNAFVKLLTRSVN